MQALIVPGQGGPPTAGLAPQGWAGAFRTHPPGSVSEKGICHRAPRVYAVTPPPPHGKARAECPRRRLTSLHTSIVPNTTCRPSKKLSPMMMTVAPPVVQPSLGLMALMHGVAAHTRQRRQTLAPGRPRRHSPTSSRPGAAGGEAGHASGRRAIIDQHADVFKANY